MGLTLLSDTPHKDILFATCDGQGYFIDSRINHTETLKTFVEDIQYFFCFPEFESFILLGRFDIEIYFRNRQVGLERAITADGFWNVEKKASSVRATGWRAPDQSFLLEIDASNGEVIEIQL